ncbi:hypothetical protein [Corallococcus exiguus]|uniref:hypothetical protein n=1 Tax=Corallococcus exiguus TaxID=83462 RepID=UPI001493FF93|nr:hypothetical protein [Corallococcus exiguus]NPD29334.1 hypothetical protein [Corallococcus exiguus]
MNDTLLLLLIAVFVGVPVLLWRLLLKYRGLTVRLRQEGVRARAEVQSVTRYARSQQRHVFYAFALPDGLRMFGNFRGAPGAGDWEPGSTVEVVYLADLPHHNMRVGSGVERKDVIRGTVLLVLVLTVGVLGVLNAHWRIEDIRRQEMQQHQP